MSQFLLFPDLETEVRTRPVNVSSVPQRSPFRYPGGKTWFVPLFRKWIHSFAIAPKTLVEPFAGGGIISLTAAFEKLTEKAILVEMDDQIAAVWETILCGDADWLAKRIVSFELTPRSAKAEFSKTPSTRREIAFQTILKNRTSHGGILAGGAGILKNGENGKGIHSRWYPQTLARRIANIELAGERIRFIHGDAFDVLAKYKNDEGAVFFIDPPYTVSGKSAGSRLYKHSEIDHDRLFSTCRDLKGGFLMTYDNADEVRALARKYGFEVKPIAMKNTHHAEMTELVIGRDLKWMESKSILCERSIPFGRKVKKRGGFKKAIRKRRRRVVLA